MKKIYAINGSPRKNKNTATLLDKVLEGAKKADPDVLAERIDLYSLKYTGCRSCFACKRKDGASYGKCAVRDDLYDVLEKLRDADARWYLDLPFITAPSRGNFTHSTRDSSFLICSISTAIPTLCKKRFPRLAFTQ